MESISQIELMIEGKRGKRARTRLLFFSLCFFIFFFLFLFVLSMYASSPFVNTSTSTTSWAPTPISAKLILSSTTPNLAKVSSQETAPPSLFTTKAWLSDLAASVSASGVASGGSSRLTPPSWSNNDRWWDVAESGLSESCRFGQDSNTLEEGCESRRSGLWPEKKLWRLRSFGVSGAWTGCGCQLVVHR